MAFFKLLAQIWAWALILLNAVPPWASAADAMMPEAHRSFLASYCVKCHNAEKQKGKLRLDDISFTIDSVEKADRWQKILNKLNAGEMPPDDSKQPEPTAKTDFLDSLSSALVTARKSLGDRHGQITMRRLNRREYQNTLRELLGVDINVAELPSDVAAPGAEVVFDTVGSNLFVSSSQIEQYLSLGREALDDAFERHAALGSEKKLRIEAESSLPDIKKAVADEKERYEQFKRWAAAVALAAAKPENVPVVAALLKGKKDEVLIRRNWNKISGAPSPEAFGFKRQRPNTDDAQFADFVEILNEHSRFHPYYQSYLQMPRLNDGAYFTVPIFTRCSSIISVTLKSRFYIAIPGNWPAGDYVVRFRIAATENAKPEQRFIEFGVGSSFFDERWEATSTHEVTGNMEHPQVIEVPVSIRKISSDRGDRTFFIREKGGYYRFEIATAQERNRKLFDAAYERNGAGPEFNLWLDWMEVEGKPKDAAPAMHALEGIPLDDKAPAPTPEKLRAAFERFATEAFRGTPPRSAFIDRLLGMYQSYRSEGKKHSEALKDTLAIVLASPPMLYLAEPVSDGTQRTLSAAELATRLSYFLWGSPPDATLRKLADSGELNNPAVLAAQTERLLDDPRSQGFIRPFFHQWLVLDRLNFFKFSRKLFPAFDDGTEVAARKEVYETVSYLIRTNSNLCDLLSCDYIIANQVLARFYGIEGVTGDQFQKVTLPKDSPRGGLIGMAAILAMGGNGQRTSPVERGAWVLRKLLNDPPPPAPANVPQLNRLADKILTSHERLQAHQEAPQCASCHRKIDPIGFGLENFDPVGQWRTQDSYQALDAAGKPIPKAVKTWAIDPSGSLYKGPAFRNYFELRDIIASRREPFARGFSAALIQYALGRPCGFSDDPLIDAMVHQAEARQFAVREFIHTLVNSKAFHSK